MVRKKDAHKKGAPRKSSSGSAKSGSSRKSSGASSQRSIPKGRSSRGSSQKRPSTPSRGPTKQTKRTSPSSSSSSSFSSSSGVSSHVSGTGTDPQAQLLQLRSKWEDLAGAVALATLLSELDSTRHTVESLESEIAGLRSRGYRYHSEWEEQAADLRARWPDQETEALRLVDDQRYRLQSTANSVEQLLQRAERQHSLAPQLDRRLSDLERQIDEAQRRVRGIFDSTESGARSLRAELNQARFVMDNIESASFDLYPEEYPIAACKAVWVSDREEPEGLLFLTDGRLIFEQREKKATKKILFIVTEKELVQEMLWDSPIGNIEEMEAEDKRAFLKRQELLTLRFTERTRDLPGDVTVQLKGSTNEVWTSLIRRAKTGQLDTERVAFPEEEAEEAISTDLPTVCPSCGGKLPPIFKGMREITCDYCGMLVRF
ncbi:MAG: hypothetical protein ACLFTI_12760 [Anaerolineales bacterium]